MIRIYRYGGPKQNPTGLDYAEAEVARQRALWDMLCDISDNREKQELEAVVNPDQVRRDLLNRLADIASAPEINAKRAQKLERVEALRVKFAETQITPATPELVKDAHQLQSLYEQLNNVIVERQKLKAQSDSHADFDEINQKIRQLSNSKNDCRISFYKQLKGWRAANKLLLQVLDQDRDQSVYDAKKVSGLYIHNATAVHDRFRQTQQRAIKKGRRVRKSDPKRDDGVLRVQFGGGRTWDDLCKPSRMFSITPDGKHHIASISADRDNNPLVIRFRIHRPIPKNARVKELDVVWRQEGERRRYYLCLAVAIDEPVFDHPSTSAIGVDFGWTLRQEGLQICTTVDNHGKVKRHYLPHSLLQRIEQRFRLQSNISQATTDFAFHWHRESAELPERWSQYLSKWSPGRSINLVDRAGLHDEIRSALLDGELELTDLPCELARWYRRFRHLHAWAQNLSRKFALKRQEQYRQIAREIALNYSSVALKHINLAELAKTKKRASTGKSLSGTDAMTAQYRQRAAIHLLVNEIKWQCEKSHAQLVTVSEADACQCNYCHTALTKLQLMASDPYCLQCGSKIDSELSGARNLLDFVSEEVRLPESDSALEAA